MHNYDLPSVSESLYKAALLGVPEQIIREIENAESASAAYALCLLAPAQGEWLLGLARELAGHTKTDILCVAQLLLGQGYDPLKFTSFKDLIEFAVLAEGLPYESTATHETS